MPAHNLTGKELDDGWVVSEKIDLGPKGTGGNFSVPYKVRNKQGQEAFMKAANFSRAFEAPEPLKALQDLLNEHNFEQMLHEVCKENKLSKIVKPIGSGVVDSGHPGLLEKNVHYMIFELAEYGDLRSESSRKKAGNLEWILQNIHNITTGIKQLHSKNICHQDLKPSNVLVYKSNVSKITDLGRSSSLNHPFKWDDLNFPGDPQYAPIEKMWKLPYLEFSDRFATDLYMLGSLFYYHFFDVPATSAIWIKLRSMNVDLGGSDYFSDALPYIQNAFAETIVDMEAKITSLGASDSLKMNIVNLVKDLCNPDPRERGNRGARNKRMQYNLEKYISKLDRYSKMAGIEKV